MNNSLSQTAKAIPLFKSGSKPDVDNYRSISLLPVLSKIFEKIMYNRLINILDKNDMINEKQLGFRSEHSTNIFKPRVKQLFKRLFASDEYVL